ncbi:transcriptional regulator [Pseudomonas sp. CCM 7891]|uniref:Transcriptional regulator n=1 Tax=Pseudomonas karstica TaxID=1055468 RepID=A0A7X2RUF4_9PSED|nr:transcriptional regulator [Pseudomonas karstica]MTD20215.1 transcriptional regulator [Pseudomonas karstica]
MNVKPIRTPEDLAAARARAEQIWGAEVGSTEGDELGLTAHDLEPFIGTSGRVSEVLNRKRRLSLPMIKRPHEGLRIPYESLLAGVS